VAQAGRRAEVRGGRIRGIHRGPGEDRITEEDFGTVMPKICMLNRSSGVGSFRGLRRSGPEGGPEGGDATAKIVIEVGT
jgi:hypothetical protein